MLALQSAKTRHSNVILALVCEIKEGHSVCSNLVILTGTAVGIQLHLGYSSKQVEETIAMFRRKHQTNPASAIESCELNLRPWPPGEACLDRSPNGTCCAKV
jgi:hypothetical protein